MNPKREPFNKYITNSKLIPKNTWDIAAVSFEPVCCSNNNNSVIWLTTPLQASGKMFRGKTRGPKIDPRGTSKLQPRAEDISKGPPSEDQVYPS